MKHLRLLLLPAALLLTWPAHAEPPSPDDGAPSVLSQGRRARPPVKGEDGEEVEVPEYDEKLMQCMTKCQEPVARCINQCAEGNQTCKSRCAQKMERCARKCGVK